MTDSTPVLDRALRLQNEVRRLEAGAQGEGQALRIAGRVAEIQSALTGVARQVRAARALQRHNPDAAIDLTGLDAGRDGLARRAAGSIPSDAAFVAARRKVEATATRLTAEVQAAWKAWADQQLTALPDHMIAVLHPDQQAEARTTLKNLRNLAAAKNITATDIAEYASAYRGLMEELSETMDVPETVATIMNRVSGGGVTLRDLNDDEIALLRAYRMDSEIEVRRKSG